MFYKNNYLPETTIDQLTDSPEFISVLCDKMSVMKGHDLGLLQGKNNEGHLLCTIPVVCDKDSLKTYTTIKGTRILNTFTKKVFQDQYRTLTSLDLIPITKEQYYTQYNCLNKDIIELSKTVLEDFYNIQVKKLIKDKLGQEYTMTIVSNADTTIGDTLIVDRLYLENLQGELIGSLKVKYTTDIMREKLNKLDDQASQQFVNCATVDYSDLNNEYRNKGLGYVMYFHMAQYLTSQHIDFRESTIQSDYAKRLWTGIRNNLSSFLKFATVNNKENTAFLNIGKDYCLDFMENKLIIKDVKEVASQKYKI